MRYLSSQNTTVIENRFIAAIQPEKTAAAGLLEAIMKAWKATDVPTDLLVGVTTDGEAANTGAETGLWKILENYLEQKLITVWCYCHHSDLAMESAIATVSEIEHWLSHTTAVAKYFRTSLPT